MSARDFPTIWVPSGSIGTIVQQPAPELDQVIDNLHPFAIGLRACYLANHVFHNGTANRWPSLVQPVIDADAPVESMQGSNLSLARVAGFPSMVNSGGSLMGGSDNNNTHDPNGVDLTILLLWNPNGGAGGRIPMEKSDGGPGEDFNYEIQANDNARVNFKGTTVSNGSISDSIFDWFLWYMAIDESAATLFARRYNLSRPGTDESFTSGARGTTDRGRSVGSSGAGAFGGVFFWHRFISRGETDEHAYRLWDMFRPAIDLPPIGKAAAGGLALVKFAPETVNVADGLQHQLELLRFGNDTEEIADGVTRPMALTRFDNTVEQVADGLAHLLDMVRVFDTTEQIADTSTDSLGLLRFGNDDVDIADGVIPIMGIVRFADDTLNIADAVQHQLELLRFGDDTVNVADALVRARDMVRVLDSTLNIADAEVRAMALVRALGDAVEVADSLLHLLGLIRFTPDTIEVADALIRVRGLIEAIDETEEIADAALEKVTPVAGLAPQFANDTENIADAVLGQLGIPQTLAATVNVADALVRVCKPVASLGVLKIYDGTRWVSGPEMFPS